MLDAAPGQTRAGSSRPLPPSPVAARVHTDPGPIAKLNRPYLNSIGR
jgi:hypothetical protein